MSGVYSFKTHYVPCVHQRSNIQTYQRSWFCAFICIGRMYLRTNPTEPQGCKLVGSKTYYVHSHK